MTLQAKTNQYFHRRYRMAEYSCLGAGTLSVLGSAVALFGHVAVLDFIGIAAALWFALVAVMILCRKLIPGRYLMFRFGTFEQSPVTDRDMKTLRVTMAHTPNTFDKDFVHQVDRIITYAEYNAVVEDVKRLTA